jgi:murein DD-endopeptidase MepM/ murein hydrolase activator NlpD
MKRYILVPLDRRRSVQGSALIGIFSAVALAVVAGGLGVWLGGQGLLTLDLGGTTRPTVGIQGDPDKLDQRIQQITWPLGQQVDQQAAKNEDINAHIDAVSGQVGAMQAEILRLNALGERLVEMAGLSKDEFDFQAPPPQGGPDLGSKGSAGIDALAEELASVLSELDDRKRKLTLLEQLIMERHLGEQLAAPSGWPVRAGYISSTFGFRKDPFRGRGAFHKGLDFAGVRGSPVLAVAEGVVTFSGRQSGYGNLVEIRHPDGKVTRYGHCDRLLVKEGASIDRGQTIATLGSTGRSTGPHVHFEVLIGGKQVNPIKYVDQTNLVIDTSTAGDRSDG